MKEKWTLTGEALEKLLALLDSDRERAGEKYERIRGKLVSFFRWRGSLEAEECADRTFDRVTRRIGEGAQLRVGDPYAYFHGVAINVLRESWRSSPRQVDAPESALRQQPAGNSLEQEEPERQCYLDCLDRCLEALPVESRRLVLVYHAPAGSKASGRSGLAETLGIPLNALRIRVYRIRMQLAQCVSRCAEESLRT